MKKRLLKESLMSVFMTLMMIVLFFLVVRYKEVLSKGVIFGISYCLNVLLPSLLPMIFLSSFASLSSVGGFLSSVFGPACRKIFKLSKNCVCPIIFGLFCGYPVGAKLTSIAYKKGEISREEAERLSLFAINPGVAYCVIFVGGVIFKDVKIGINFLISTCVSSLVLGILWGIGKKIPVEKDKNKDKKDFIEIASTSSKSTLSACSSMCIYVVIFSAFIPLLREIGIVSGAVDAFSKIPILSPFDWSAVVNFLLDVVTAVELSLLLPVSMGVFAMGLAFGGLCIHFQIFSMFPQKTIDYKKFFTSRISHGLLSMALFNLINSFVKEDVSVFSSVNEINAKALNGTLMGSICLVILSCAFIFLNKSVEKRKKMW